MQYRMFAVPVTGVPDLEEELNQFLRAHRVISVQKTVETVGGTAMWCFCVEYLEGNGKPSGRGGGGAGRTKRIDYKEVLSEDEFSVYARLREVRKELAEAETVPVYAVCTNEQLAALAKAQPKNLAELRRIEGLGDAKSRKYGESLLAALALPREVDGEEGGKPD